MEPLRTPRRTRAPASQGPTRRQPRGSVSKRLASGFLKDSGFLFRDPPKLSWLGKGGCSLDQDRYYMAVVIVKMVSYNLALL